MDKNVLEQLVRKMIASDELHQCLAVDVDDMPGLAHALSGGGKISYELLDIGHNSVSEAFLLNLICADAQEEFMLRIFDMQKPGRDTAWGMDLCISTTDRTLSADHRLRKDTSYIYGQFEEASHKKYGLILTKRLSGMDHLPIRLSSLGIGGLIDAGDIPKIEPLLKATADSLSTVHRYKPHPLLSRLLPTHDEDFITGLLDQKFGQRMGNPGGDYTSFREVFIEQIFRRYLMPRPNLDAATVHGDAREPNILYGGAPSAPEAQLIDFSTLAYGDPEEDLALFMNSIFANPLRLVAEKAKPLIEKRFIRLYESSSQRKVDLPRYYAWKCVYGMVTAGHYYSKIPGDNFAAYQQLSADNNLDEALSAMLGLARYELDQSMARTGLANHPVADNNDDLLVQELTIGAFSACRHLVDLYEASPFYGQTTKLFQRIFAPAYDDSGRIKDLAARILCEIQYQNCHRPESFQCRADDALLLLNGEISLAR